MEQPINIEKEFSHVEREMIEEFCTDLKAEVLKGKGEFKIYVYNRWSVVFSVKRWFDGERFISVEVIKPYIEWAFNCCPTTPPELKAVIQELKMELWQEEKK